MRRAFKANINRQFIDRNALMALKRMQAGDPSLYRRYVEQLRAGDFVLDPAAFDMIDGDRAGDSVVALRAR